MSIIISILRTYRMIAKVILVVGMFALSECRQRAGTSMAEFNQPGLFATARRAMYNAIGSLKIMDSQGFVRFDETVAGPGVATLSAAITSGWTATVDSHPVPVIVLNPELDVQKVPGQNASGKACAIWSGSNWETALQDRTDFENMIIGVLNSCKEILWVRYSVGGDIPARGKQAYEKMVAMGSLPEMNIAISQGGLIYAAAEQSRRQAEPTSKPFGKFFVGFDSPFKGYLSELSGPFRNSPLLKLLPEVEQMTGGSPFLESIAPLMNELAQNPNFYTVSINNSVTIGSDGLVGLDSAHGYTDKGHQQTYNSSSCSHFNMTGTCAQELTKILVAILNGTAKGQYIGFEYPAGDSLFINGRLFTKDTTGNYRLPIGNDVVLIDPLSREIRFGGSAIASYESLKNGGLNGITPAKLTANFPPVVSNFIERQLPGITIRSLTIEYLPASGTVSGIVRLSYQSGSNILELTGILTAGPAGLSIEIKPEASGFIMKEDKGFVMLSLSSAKLTQTATGFCGSFTVNSIGKVQFDQTLKESGSIGQWLTETIDAAGEKARKFEKPDEWFAAQSILNFFANQTKVTLTANVTISGSITLGYCKGDTDMGRFTLNGYLDGNTDGKVAALLWSAEFAKATFDGSLRLRVLSTDLTHHLRGEASGTLNGSGSLLFLKVAKANLTANLNMEKYFNSVMSEPVMNARFSWDGSADLDFLITTPLVESHGNISVNISRSPTGDRITIDYMTDYADVGRSIKCRGTIQGIQGTDRNIQLLPQTSVYCDGRAGFVFQVSGRYATVTTGVGYITVNKVQLKAELELCTRSASHSICLGTVTLAETTAEPVTLNF